MQAQSRKQEGMTHGLVLTNTRVDKRDGDLVLKNTGKGQALKNTGLIALGARAVRKVTDRLGV